MYIIHVYTHYLYTNTRLLKYTAKRPSWCSAQRFQWGSLIIKVCTHTYTHRRILIMVQASDKSTSRCVFLYVRIHLWRCKAERETIKKFPFIYTYLLRTPNKYNNPLNLCVYVCVYIYLHLYVITCLCLSFCICIYTWITSFSAYQYI